VERLLALALLTLAFAGCAAPDPPAAAVRPHERFEVIDAADDAVEPSAASPPVTGGDASDEDAVVTEDQPAPGATPADDASTDGGEAPSEASGTETLGPGDTALPGPPSPASPMVRAERPSLKVGDRWIFRGVNRTGAPLDEERVVFAASYFSGLPVWVMNVSAQGKRLQERVTHDLDPVNDTGFVTELLRFPLEAGGNWVFDWRENGNATGATAGRTSSAGWSQWLHGEAVVLGAENMSTAGGKFETMHVRTNVTTGVGSLTAKRVQLDYWYAPAAKSIVRIGTVDGLGQRTWSELVQARV
jgi:hypothetical protein